MGISSSAGILLRLENHWHLSHAWKNAKASFFIVGQ